MNLFDITYVPAFMDNQWQFDGNSPHCLHVLIADDLVQETALQTWDVDPAGIHHRPHFKSQSRAIRKLVLTLFQGLRQGVSDEQLEHVGHSLSLQLLLATE